MEVTIVICTLVVLASVAVWLMILNPKDPREQKVDDLLQWIHFNPNDSTLTHVVDLHQGLKVDIQYRQQGNEDSITECRVTVGENHNGEIYLTTETGNTFTIFGWQFIQAKVVV